MPSYKNLADVFQGGATTSQHVDARDDEDFKNNSFALKRTRSLGLLDDFIIPGAAKVKDDFVTDETVNKINQNQNQNQNQKMDSQQPKELKHRLPKINTSIPKQTLQKKNSILYNSDSSDDESDDEDENENYLPHSSTITKNQNQNQKLQEQEQEQEQNQDQHPEQGPIIERSSSHSPTPTMLSPEFLPHDDNDLLYEPQRHVDYLSHDWKESDISKSWRYIVLKRKDVTNSARLENASWRTWAQAKNHLKTVSPESVNWLKESDVTWLYGPLYKEPSTSGDFLLDDNNANKYPSNSNSNSHDKLKENNHSCDVKGPKPILKKRTAAEMMLSQAEYMKLSLMHNMQAHQWNPHTGSPILEAINHSNSPPQFRHQDSHGTASPVSLNSPLIKNGSNTIDQSAESVATSNHSSSILSGNDADKKKNRHIHFNDNVRQCIAIDVISDDENNKRESIDDDNLSNSSSSDDDEDDDDKGGFCLNVRSPSSAFLYQQGLQQPPTPQKQDEEDEEEEKETKTGSIKSNNSEQYQTIALLPSTHLNYKSSDDESNEEEEEKEYTSIPFYDNRVSHNVNTNRNYDYHYNYDYNSIYPNNIEVKDIINNKDNDNLQVYDIPADLDLGSVIQIDQVEDVGEEIDSNPTNNNINNNDESFLSLNSNSSSSLKKSNSGYNIKEQQPLPPFQSNTSVNGSGFYLGKDDVENWDDEESHLRKNDNNSNNDDVKFNNNNNNNVKNDNNNTNNNNYNDVNQRLQKISSSDCLNNNNNNSQYTKLLSSKTKDLANAFLGNWKK